ncbi:hypothetical protein BH10PLA1_BH10PLA1_18030 [soil metagenome]
MGKHSGFRKLLVAVAGISLSVLGAATTNAAYTTIQSPWPGEASQSQILSHSYGGNFVQSGLNFTNGKVTAVRVDDSKDQVFHFDIASIKTLSAFSGGSQGLAFGTLDNEHKLFDVTGKNYSAVGGTGHIDMPSSYSLIRTGTGQDYSSNVSVNPDGADHLVTYLLKGVKGKDATYVMFWEDQTAKKSDFDYNDFAIQVKSGCATVVPLPAAAWSGLVTLAGGALVTGYRKARRQMA